MLGFPVQNYSGVGQMAIFITLHQKLLLHRGAIDIHFLALAGDYPLRILVPFPTSIYGPHQRKTVRAAAVPALVAPGGKFDYYIVIYIFLSYGCERILLPLWVIKHIVEKLSLMYQRVFFCLFVLLFRIPMGGGRKYTLPLHIMLKFKGFNIYLRQGNTGFQKSNMLVHV